MPSPAMIDLGGIDTQKDPLFSPHSNFVFTYFLFVQHTNFSERPTSTRATCILQGSKQQAEDDHDAERTGASLTPAVYTSACNSHVDTLESSNMTVSTRLRAETSKIVGCVAKYCEEGLEKLVDEVQVPAQTPGLDDLKQR